LDHLGLAGASFFGDLCRVTGCHPPEIEEAIGELVSAGLVTGDGFAGLRGLLQGARRRSDVQRYSRRGLHHHPPAPGRWSLFLVGPELPVEEIREAWARQLLRRYGVIFRDLVQRDAPLPWRELSATCRTLEAR